ncbi:ABC transporter substrate-binding protein [Flammeovirga yaeyamensis]|uniref:ABC transporter substrate-binding protein n=1 Tax=Flammeovirga yaeyamensis TaxID=367791 RepID=A0AAX1N2H0_9BACT|nr:ABC transporter substrate-binding protein [Flammeovirga yaeyamensis]MBB3696138.1 iron complex transport system substrate-binding protein [Flammeovirga yaeyamensis]NMF34822.1 ABC transporter substrate-binding protein [Flammeovirga yaeyamensis]QWG00350.1 ABC transporter substrate-binding protein [Flammeovirga yaeyamensis]
MNTSKFPNRIVCLTDEVTEWLYMLGESHRIVGISAFAERPAEAKLEKPMVCGFTGANYKKILDQKPDMVIGFSDLQAEIGARLIKEGIPTLITNQRSVEEIINTLEMIARMIGAEHKAAVYIEKMRSMVRSAQLKTKHLTNRPKVYFEEWNSPLITGIKWVSEMIELAGGEDVFSELSVHQSAQERVLFDFNQVIDKAPEIGLFCWCGRKFDEAELLNRNNINQVPFYQTKDYQEVDPLFMLQPGPAAILEGLPFLERIIEDYNNKK